MSNERRIIPIIIDVQNGYPVVSVADRQPVPTPITLYDKTLLIYQALFINAAGEAVAVPEGASWIFGIGDDFDHIPVVLSNADQFNIAADWSEVAPAAGKVCWRADLTDSRLATALAGKNSLTSMYANLWMSTTAGWDLKCQWNVNLMPVAINPTTATAGEGISHVTIQQAAAAFVPQWGDQSRWRWRDGGWQYLFEEDSAWRAFAPRLVNGQPTIAWSDPL